MAIGGAWQDWFGREAGRGGLRRQLRLGLGHTPTFVFSENLGDDEKNVAEAVTHEVGHTLGLLHDGTASGRLLHRPRVRRDRVGRR